MQANGLAATYSYQCGVWAFLPAHRHGSQWQVTMATTVFRYVMVTVGLVLYAYVPAGMYNVGYMGCWCIHTCTCIYVIIQDMGMDDWWVCIKLIGSYRVWNIGNKSSTWAQVAIFWSSGIFLYWWLGADKILFTVPIDRYSGQMYKQSYKADTLFGITTASLERLLPWSLNKPVLLCASHLYVRPPPPPSPPSPSMAGNAGNSWWNSMSIPPEIGPGVGDFLRFSVTILTTPTHSSATTHTLGTFRTLATVS